MTYGWHIKSMRICSISLVFREMQIKTTVNSHYTLTRMAAIETTGHTKCWQGFR